MSVRRSSIVLMTIAAVLLALASVVRFVAVPYATKLPADADLTAHYAGTATMLNSKALQSGDTAHALTSGIPVTADRRVKVTSVHGDTAVVEDTTTLRLGKQSLPSSQTYAVDRKSRKGTSPPASTSVEPSRGALSSAFPPHAARNDSYTYYDPTTRSIVPVHYTGSTKREGRTVNVYRITVSAPVKDPAVLAPLPPGLPKRLVTGLTPALAPAARARLTPAALSALPDPVPLTYSSRSTLVAYVDRQTGIAVDQTMSRHVVAVISAGGEPAPLLPVSAFTLEITPKSAAHLGDTAASAGLLLTLLGTVAPLALAAVALVLLVIALLPRRGKRPDTSAAPDPAPATVSSD